MEEAWFLTTMRIREADSLMSLLAVSQDCETRRQGILRVSTTADVFQSLHCDGKRQLPRKYSWALFMCIFHDPLIQGNDW